MPKTWNVKEKISEDFIEKFPEYSSTTLQLLWNRGLHDQKAIDEFFNPDYIEDLHDPFLYTDMGKAVEIVAAALEKGEKIHLFGDYDHDGISGVALLYLFLKLLGAKTEVYIPDRSREGYGLNKQAVEKIIRSGSKIIITIDCGTTNVEEVALARRHGLKVIILDHHIVQESPPEADALINAKRPDDIYPFEWLSGAGVAFKFVQAFAREKGTKYEKNLPQGFEKWFLDFVAIAAVGDMVPLLGENRTLVTYGLVVLAQTRSLGLKALMEIAGLEPKLLKNTDPSCEIPLTNLDTHSLGFIIIPRINAASRMDHANVAFELMTTQDESEARVLAKRLDDTNKDRQKAMESTAREIEKRISQYEHLPPIIFEGSKSWNSGLLGVVASRFVGKYARPVFLYGEDKDIARGSCRALGSFNVVTAMGEYRDVLHDFGGHAHAGGFSLSEKHLEEFQTRLEEYTKKNFTEEDFRDILEIESELDPLDISWELYDELERFAPFGEANPKPLFLLRNLLISDIRYVGKDERHMQLRFTSSQSSKIFRAIYFNGKEGNGHLKIGDTVDAVAEIRAEEWNGARELRLRIEDLKLSE